jgi:proteasome lid subunit RPN8/RPN11
MVQNATLTIGQQLVQKLREEGRQAYPHECCGALLGRDPAPTPGSPDRREILAVIPLPNRSTNSPGNRFLLAADDVLEAEKIARSKGLDVVGWYHSHPDHPATPSEEDREHALPWYSYIIVSIRNGDADDLKSWRLNDDRSGYSEEAVAVQFEAAAPEHANE